MKERLKDMIQWWDEVMREEEDLCTTEAIKVCFSFSGACLLPLFGYQEKRTFGSWLLVYTCINKYWIWGTLGCDKLLFLKFHDLLKCFFFLLLFHQFSFHFVVTGWWWAGLWRSCESGESWGMFGPSFQVPLWQRLSNPSVWTELLLQADLDWLRAHQSWDFDWVGDPAGSELRLGSGLIVITVPLVLV